MVVSYNDLILTSYKAAFRGKVFCESVKINVRLDKLKMPQSIVKLLSLDSMLVHRERLRDRFLEFRRHQVDGQRVEEERLLASVEGRGFAFAAFGPGT